MEMVQVKNPRTEKYVLINKSLGKIVKHHPRRNQPYKGVKVVSK